MALLTEILAGTISRSPPPNFALSDVDGEPVPRAELSWDQVTDADLQQDFLVISDPNSKLPSSGQAPPKTMAHRRTVEGYIIHKGSPGFTEDGTQVGEGNVLADQNTLTPATTTLEDTSVVVGQQVAYKAAVVIEDIQ